MPYARLLSQVEIFADLSLDELERIAAICTERRYDADEIIFQEHTSSSELFVILRGEVAIQVEAEQGAPKAEALTIARLRQGQSFGEVALVDEGIRSATARCGAPETRLLLIRRDDLLRLCKEDYRLGFLLMRNLAGDLALKIRQTDLQLRPGLMWKPHE